MKYIDADKLRTEIDAFYTKYKAKFHQNGDSYHLGIIDGLDMAERILDTLEEPVSEDLEEAAEAYSRQVSRGHNYRDLTCGFIAGAEWQKKQTLMPEDTVIFQKGVEEGRRLEREDALTIADIEKLHTFLYAVKNNKQ